MNNLSQFRTFATSRGAYNGLSSVLQEEKEFEQDNYSKPDVSLSTLLCLSPGGK